MTRPINHNTNIERGQGEYVYDKGMTHAHAYKILVFALHKYLAMIVLCWQRLGNIA